MKPTEADIQAELDRHGLGWVVTGAAFLGKAYTAGWADIGHPSDTMVIIAYGSGEKFQFKRKPEDIEIEYDDFLTGNYDLSAISHHYEPEEWQRIITMCERIVRLITGEQVEQSLEEKVREIASKAKLDISYIHDDEVSLCNTVHQYWIKADRVTYNTPQGSHIEKTITGYYDGFGNYRHEFKSIAALLTAQPESEQTLEEAVRGLLEKSEFITADFEITDNGDSIEIKFPRYTATIFRDRVRDTESGATYMLPDLEKSDFVEPLQEVLKQIAAELSTRSTKPSYTELEQRVEELEKESKRIAGDYDEVYDECEEAKKRHREARKLMERYQEDALKAKQKYDNLLADYQRECEALENMRERLEKSEAENASLLDKFGPIDQAEQMYAQADHQVKSFATKLERWAQGIIQLNEEIL